MCNGQEIMPRNMYVGVKVLVFEWLLVITDLMEATLEHNNEQIMGKVFNCFVNISLAAQ